MFGDLWETVGRIRVPVMLARGMLPESVIRDEDEAELRRRLPDVDVVRFEKAGHSIQGDMPVELARAIESFVDS
jgi:pimeloyl-ACP methyl ester carboxylesterase